MSEKRKSQEKLEQKQTMRGLYFCALALVFAVGFAARLLLLERLPLGLNFDEAFSGYEAFCMATTGRDAYGLVNPVYLPCWGGGMNALYAYLTLPFIRLLGHTVLAIRLPQALMGCLSLVVFWDLARRLGGRGFALCAAFLLAINPWHVMAMRWGLESNLLPAFLLLAIYFWVLAQEKEAWYLASAAAFGLSLYCYTAAWLLVPGLLVVFSIYSLCTKGLHLNHWLPWLALGLLAVLALPLLLFVLVNRGQLEPIALSWISIPRMQYWRGSEILIGEIPTRLKETLLILWTGYDGQPFMTMEGTGLFYPFTILLAIAGVVCMAVTLLRKKGKLFFFVLAELAVGLGVASIYSAPNAVRVNSLFLFVVLAAAYGLWCGAGALRRYRVAACAVVAAVYLCFFARFAYDYTHRQEYIFTPSMPVYTRASQLLAETTADRVVIVGDFAYPNVMFCNGIDPALYQEAIGGNAGAQPSQLGIYSTIPVEELGVPEKDAIYLCYAIDLSSCQKLEEAGYTLETVEQCVVATPPEA